jgi:hypothetical protein
VETFGSSAVRSPVTPPAWARPEIAILPTPRTPAPPGRRGGERREDLHGTPPPSDVPATGRDRLSLLLHMTSAYGVFLAALASYGPIVNRDHVEPGANAKVTPDRVQWNPARRPD